MLTIGQPIVRSVPNVIAKEMATTTLLPIARIARFVEKPIQKAITTGRTIANNAPNVQKQGKGSMYGTPIAILVLSAVIFGPMPTIGQKTAKPVQVATSEGKTATIGREIATNALSVARPVKTNTIGQPIARNA